MSDPTEPTPDQTPPQAQPAQAPQPPQTAQPAHPDTVVPPVAPAPWAAPGAAPFGPPAGYVPPAAPHATTPGYAPPVGYAVPPVAGQPTAAPYAAPPYAGALAAPRDAGGRGLGVTALVLSLVATVGAAIAVAVAGFGIGMGAGREIALNPIDADFDWSMLAPVRDQVLLGEIAFWLGTVIGVWALVQGIVAIVKNRGRGAGIAAVVIAALGPIVFFVALQGFLAAGFAAGSGIGG